LRAQIARITHSTTLVPKNIYKINEENNREIEENIPDEGPVPIPSTVDMAKPENWLHFTPNILRAARLVHMEPEVPDGVEIDPEELKK